MDNLIEIGQQAAVAVMVVIGLILSIVFGVQSENPDAFMSSDTGNMSTNGGDIGVWKPDIPGGDTDDTDNQDSYETAPKPTELDAPHLGNPGELNQGDRITIAGRTGGYIDCTVGYVDAQNNRAYTAAHCMGDVYNGKREFVGGDVYMCYSDASCAFSDARVGTIHYAGRYLGSAPYDDSHTFTTPTGKNEGVANRDISTDIAVIELSGNARPGRNAISGNGGATISPKKQLCYYGATTGNSTGKSICGYEFMSPFIVNSHAVFVTGNMGVQRGARAGDSGGAVFSPNGGIVGIVSKEQGQQGNTFYAPFNPQ